MAIRSNRNWEK